MDVFPLLQASLKEQLKAVSVSKRILSDSGMTYDSAIVELIRARSNLRSEAALSDRRNQLPIFSSDVSPLKFISSSGTALQLDLRPVHPLCSTYRETTVCAFMVFIYAECVNGCHFFKKLICRSSVECTVHTLKTHQQRFVAELARWKIMTPAMETGT